MAPSKDDEFDWETYMGDKAYTPASQEAFYQNPEIPENRFKVGKKVAIQDPRVPDSKCLGHIITVDKIWICVSLSGEKFAEYWLNCDDETLWPLSEVIKEGPLQPPKNFEGNPEKYMDYVDQQLQYDEDTEEDPRAPPEWFNRISPKLKPKENLFKPGMKLEVPDLKRFKAELYPAAVRSVNGNIVNVGFDGWGKKFDMTDTNECRFFYPVGTAKKIGVRLVPPPGYGAKATPKPKATPKTKTPKTVTEKKLNGNSAAATPASSKSTPINKTIPAKTPRKSAVGTSPKKSTAPLKSAGRRTDLKRNNSASSSEPDEKKPKLEDIKTASTKKYVPSLADALAKTTPSSAKKTPKSPAKKRKPISSVADDHHANSHSEIVLLPAKDIKPSDLTFQFFVNPTCYRTDLLNREKLPRLHPKFGAGNVHHIMREFLQQVVDVSSKPQEIIKAIPIKSPNILGVYAVIDGLEHAKFLPVARNIDHAWNIMNELFDKLKFCSNFITRTPKSCSHCPFLNRGQSNQKSKPSSAVTPIKQDSEASSSISSPIPALPKSIKQWNVNQLCSQITKLVPYSVVHTFREHEIDGKAAVLLDEDTLITMLRIPPNYAAKLMEFIDSKSDEV